MKLSAQLFTKTLLTTLTRILLLLAILTLALSIQYLHAWTGPPSSAPTCATGQTGCDAPLNVGTTNQTKSGGLTVGGGAGGFAVLASQYIQNNLGVGVVSPVEKLEVNGNVKLSGAGSGVVFTDGTKQVSAANLGTVFTSRYGSGRRCAGDAWISACYYTPGNSWEYNVCVSRGHAATYGWTLNWVPAASGYQAVGYLAGSRFDVTCDI